MICAALLLALASLTGQDGDSPGDAALLHARGRETLHRGDPLRLVGREEGDNGFRHRTPGLLASERRPRELDPDELHERSLAMFESGAVFHRPPASAGNVPPTGDPRATRPTAPPAAERDGGRSLVWVAVLALVALGVVAVRTLRRA